MPVIASAPPPTGTRENLDIESFVSELLGDYNVSLQDVCPEEISRKLKLLIDSFGSRRALSGKRILDLGCGFTGCRDGEAVIKGASRAYEPWVCRALHKLGAEAVGVDWKAEEVVRERFTYVKLDLTMPDCFERYPEIFADGSFDAICCWGLADSKLLGIMNKPSAILSMLIQLEAKSASLLNSNGKIIPFEPEFASIQDVLIREMSLPRFRRR